MIRLYDYFRSTASYRVRIALQYKGLEYDVIPIHLVNNGGEQHSDAYQQVNPQQLVPTLCVDNHNLNQSLAILEYLEETFPEPSLLPSYPILRAHARSIAQMIACDIHPLNNLRVLQYLVNELEISEKQKLDWYHHWLKQGFTAIEKKLQQFDTSKPFCLGDQFSIADVCLIPQIYNAKRFKFSMEAYPRLRAIDEYCLSLPYFKKSQPSN